MADTTLHNVCILVVEDEYLLADELRAEFAEVGATVLGPVGSVDDAVRLIRAEPRIDGAVLDVSLGGDMIFPAADLLAERGVPFVFTTGYDASSIPVRFKHVARYEKPVNILKVTRAIGQAIQTNTR